MGGNRNHAYAQASARSEQYPEPGTNFHDVRGCGAARVSRSERSNVREVVGQVEAQHLVVALHPHGVRRAPFDTHKEIAEMRDGLELVALPMLHLSPFGADRARLD